MRFANIHNRETCMEYAKQRFQCAVMLRCVTQLNQMNGKKEQRTNKKKGANER